MLLRLLIIFFLFLISFSFSQDIPDGEESLIENVKKIEDGSLIYNDFQTYLAPGQFYLVNVINDFISPAAYNLLITAIIVFMLSFILRKSYQNSNQNFNKHSILINFGIIFSSGIFIYKYVDMSSSLITSFIIVLINSIFIYKYYETKKLYNLLLAGFLLGFAGIFRHDVLSYLYGAEFWGIFFFGIKFYAEKKDNWFKKFLIGMKYGIIFTIGILIAIIPVVLILMINNDTLQLYYQLIEFPLFDFKDIYGKPLPNPFDSGNFIIILKSIWFYIPLIIFAITAFKLYFNSKSKVLTSDNLKFWKIIFLFNLGINSYNQALIVSDIYHLLPALIVALMLVHFIFDNIKFKILFLYLYIFMFLLLGIM